MLGKAFARGMHTQSVVSSVSFLACIVVAVVECIDAQ
jgi:hypothetical protein